MPRLRSQTQAQLTPRLGMEAERSSGLELVVAALLRVVSAASRVVAGCLRLPGHEPRARGLYCRADPLGRAPMPARAPRRRPCRRPASTCLGAVRLCPRERQAQLAGVLGRPLRPALRLGWPA